MRVHHLSCLTMCPPAARLVDGHGPWLGRGTLVCHVLLVETPAHGLVLVDTAIGLDDCRDPAGRLGGGFAFMMGLRRGAGEESTAIRQIEAMGHRAADVRHLVVTHLDLDHAGGLPDFPHATVHVLAAEQSAALARATLFERSRYRPCHWAHGPRWATYRPDGEPWRGFPAVRALEGLPPEILMIPLTGHTRGHACVAVETPSGALLHCGDAYFHRSAVDRSAGPTPAGLRVFEEGAAVEGAARVRENHARLRELAGGERLRVFCAHDPVELERERARQGSAPKATEARA